MQVKTIFHTYLELIRATGKTFTLLDHSTVNQQLSIQHNAAIPAGSLPKQEYFMIGRGGHRAAVGAGGTALTDILQHKINSAILFEPIPLIMREIGNDLNATQRARYRLRRLEVHNGISYFAYYGLKVDLSAGDPEVKLLTTKAGVTTSADYVPTDAQQQVNPVTMVNGQPVQSTGEHISVSIPIEIVLDESAITEIVNACEIKYGDVRMATITEAGFCSAIDTTVTSNDGGVNATFTEAIAMQICNHIGANVNLQYTSNEVRFKYRLGDTQPLLT